MVVGRAAGGGRQAREATDEVGGAGKVEVVVDREQMREWRRLGEELKGEAVSGVVRVQQVAREGEQAATVVGVDIADGKVLVQQRPSLGIAVRRGVGGDAKLAAAQVAHQVHHRGKLSAGEDASRVKQCLIRHEKSAGTRFGELDRGGQMGVDALAITDELAELLAHALVHLDARLGRSGVCDAYQEVGEAQVPLDEGEGAVAMQRRTYERGGSCMLIKEDVLPGNLDVVEDDH